MDMAHIVKTPLRRSFSEHVKDSTNKAWDIIWKSAREKRLSEIEAKEACDWLCAAGFPQYAQFFTDCCFPIDIDWVKSDHAFLDKDAIDSLCRRLGTLNKCAKMKLELSRSKRRADEEVEEDLYAISPKWSFDRKSRRWIRADDGEILPMNSPISSLRRSGSCEASLSDSGEVHELSSTHSSSNADSDGGCTPNKTTEELETSRSSSRCSSNYKPTQSPETSSSRPPSPGEHHTLSGEEYFPEKPPVKKGKSLLRKVEKLRLRGNTLQPHTQSGKAKFVISGPIMQEDLGEERLKHLQCLDIARLQDKTCSPVSCTPPSGSSSSPSESSSAVSTPSPVTRVRSNCKRPWMPKQEDGQNQINEQDLNNQRNLDINPVFEIPHGHKPGTFPTVLTHNSAFSPIDNTSVNWRTGSFHGYRGRRCKSSISKDQEQACSPLATYDHRTSIYDNVPDHVQIMDDDVFSALDSVMERICGLQQLVTSWTDKLSEDGDSDFYHSGSPSPSSLTDIHLEIKEPEETDEAALDETYNKSPEVFAHTTQPTELTDRVQRSHWSSAQMLSLSKPSTGIEAKSAARVSMLQRLSLLRLTALMDKHSPFSKQGWNWTVPKVYRKVTPSEHKSRKVFGVPLLQSVQQSGKPLPPSILRAVEFLRTKCLDQVGLFRKSGVKSRIQNLRDMVEADPDNVSFENQSAFDVADMVKQYFRDLPEPIFSSKLCECFLHIYQYFPKDQQFAGVQAAIYLLTDENREALQSLLLFLQEVVACKEENQMTPTNIAVCLAPSLFHLNSFKRDRTSMRSRQRKYSLGRPDQRDLSENLAATQGLAHMVNECSHLFQIPKYWEAQGAGSFTEDSLQNDAGLSSFSHFRENEFPDCARLALLTQKLLREAREKSKGWTSSSSSDHVDVAFKKVEDGYPLRLWKGTTEVDAPLQEVFHRVLREHGQWQRDLLYSEVVETLDKDAEVYHYILQAAGARPPLQHVLLRTWQSDSTTGSLFVSSTSVEHASVAIRGVRAQVFCCFFLIEPLGSKKSRVTHLCRTDTRGRSPEWHHKVGGHLVSSVLMAMKDSFRPKTKDSKAQ
ncbi:rho GTPase-activating protein 7-like isoform X1 [Myxocyprinus asiaticus]|uniref:rho GTPase-activating protein 7-like isoform X1 n=1 Tax=Myxocyprinus asiaticus TaxID=70543 RepID=UPI00222185F7|nr:rho GTPase-activating protein 7-like isoform X1 [Myxocyprinus asiaticus]